MKEEQDLYHIARHLRVAAEGLMLAKPSRELLLTAHDIVRKVIRLEAEKKQNLEAWAAEYDARRRAEERSKEEAA